MSTDAPTYLCPGCSGRLAVGAVQGLREYTCESCGSHVLTVPALRGLDPRAATAVWQEDGTSDDAAPCPFCRRPMQTGTFGDGKEGLCRLCEAVWFDAKAAGSVAAKPQGPEEPTLASSELRCQQCGAPVRSSLDDHCQYCGAALEAPTKVVVLTRELPGEWPDAAARPGILGTIGKLLGEAQL